MKILIAEDDEVSARLMTIRLTQWGYEVICVSTGVQACETLQETAAPQLALIDWMMPEMDGIEVCRQVRASLIDSPLYLILLTARGAQEDIVKGMEGGADDYIVKPFHPQELKVRIGAGVRMIQLQNALKERVAELQEAISKVRLLQGLLPICSYCKKVRDDQDYWHKLETFISHHSGAEFSHGICPPCYEHHIQSEFDKLYPKS
jgi:sigma-B regulation protein RsbU (phosphoserine phosphatase)